MTTCGVCNKERELEACSECYNFHWVRSTGLPQIDWDECEAAVHDLSRPCREGDREEIERWERCRKILFNAIREMQKYINIYS